MNIFTRAVIGGVIGYTVARVLTNLSIKRRERKLAQAINNEVNFSASQKAAEATVDTAAQPAQ